MFLMLQIEWFAKFRKRAAAAADSSQRHGIISISSVTHRSGGCAFELPQSAGKRMFFRSEYLQKMSLFISSNYTRARDGLGCRQRRIKSSSLSHFFYV